MLIYYFINDLCICVILRIAVPDANQCWVQNKGMFFFCVTSFHDMYGIFYVSSLCRIKTVGEAITDPFLDCAAYQTKPLLLGEKGITNELCLQYCTAIHHCAYKVF